jgi:hypothetical protein
MQRSAGAMLRTHGDRAAIEASMVAERMRMQNDVPGHEAWKRIAFIIDERQAGRNRPA